MSIHRPLSADRRSLATPLPTNKRRRYIAAPILALALATLGLVAQAAPRVVAPSGTFSGQQEKNGVLSFKGLRYAAAPVGALRWRAPVASTRETSTREAAAIDATAFGAACLQPTPAQARPLRTNEDCLFLNVWTPGIDGGKRRPVMVWIHGGGFRTGSGNIPGEVIAAEDTVVVSMNYRLGPLGFIAHPSVPERTANLALLDMVAALDWIKRNIGAFGGDPDNITIFGMSAGGQAVNLLMVSPQAKGRFQRAIAQSGYATWALPRSAQAPTPAPQSATFEAAESAEAISRAVIARVSDAPQTAEMLAKLDGQALVDAVRGFQMPIVDGSSLPEEPGILFMRGRQAAVPFMTGGNSFEGSVMPESGITKEIFERVLGSELAELRAAYGDDFAVSEGQGIARIFGDYRYLLSARLLASSMARVKAQGWLYYTDLAPAQRPAGLPGTPHGYDYVLLFALNPNAPEATRALGARMRAHWASFARTGLPSPQGATTWEAYTPEADRWLVFGANDGEQAHVLKKKLDIIERNYRRRIGE